LYLVKAPSLLKPLARDLLWRMDDSKKDVYLTFDDGPTPGVTEKVLDTLKKHNVPATFFCLGKNVAAYPEIFARIKEEGHAVGNHSYDHVDGWKTSLITYAKNVLKANEVIGSNLFRPPYGRITPQQVSMLKKRFRIVMWHVISADFDQSISGEKCVQNIVENTDNGSIIVFHDSLKAADNCLYALEPSLAFFQELGFTCKTLASIQ